MRQLVQTSQPVLGVPLVYRGAPFRFRAIAGMLDEALAARPAAGAGARGGAPQAANEQAPGEEEEGGACAPWRSTRAWCCGVPPALLGPPSAHPVHRRQVPVPHAAAAVQVRVTLL